MIDCHVYRISVWDTILDQATEMVNLIITKKSLLYQDNPVVVDNLELAQFMYLLLNNERIRDVIDTITSKVVLILGRFTADKKKVLDGIRTELRKCGYTSNSMKYVASKDQKQFMSELKPVYRADNEAAG